MFIYPEVEYAMDVVSLTHMPFSFTLTASSLFIDNPGKDI